MTISVVLFDLGGVVVDVDLDRSRRRWRRVSGLSAEHFDAAFFESGLKARMDRDRLDTEDLELVVNRVTGARLRGEEVEAVWNACIEPRMEVVKLVGRVAERARVGVLSNTDSFHSALIRALPGLDEAVEHWVLSCEVGRLKPDGVIYRTALDRFGVGAAEVLFVDDKPSNVEGARALGIDGVRWTTLVEIERRLAERGLV